MGDRRDEVFLAQGARENREGFASRAFSGYPIPQRQMNPRQRQEWHPATIVILLEILVVDLHDSLIGDSRFLEPAQPGQDSGIVLQIVSNYRMIHTLDPLANLDDPNQQHLGFRVSTQLEMEKHCMVGHHGQEIAVIGSESPLQDLDRSAKLGVGLVNCVPWC